MLHGGVLPLGAIKTYSNQMKEWRKGKEGSERKRSEGRERKRKKPTEFGILGPSAAKNTQIC